VHKVEKDNSEERSIYKKDGEKECRMSNEEREGKGLALEERVTQGWR
jgi:hypothetical protein